MSVSSTREPQKIPTSQIVREWVEVVRYSQAAKARRLQLFAENSSQTGSVDVYPTMRVERATVFDEAKHFELIHKEADARACGADH
jgi:hypothetical protein